ncbi:MAG: FmdB family zinc ribbon protein [Planctomycetota bacterium]
MPMYEYVCEEDGTRIELLRSMKDADAPVDDPDGRGRTFHRVQSAFMVGAKDAGWSPSMMGGGGGCPCGDPHGPCNQ